METFLTDEIAAIKKTLKKVEANQAKYERLLFSQSSSDRVDGKGGRVTIAGQTYYIGVDGKAVFYDVKTNKTYDTPEGGRAVRLTNKTGGATVKGQVVKASTTVDDAFILTGVDETNPIGIIYEAGIADGSECWVVVSGIADVAMKDNTAATHGNWVKSSSEAGYADATNANPPGGGIPQLDEHILECGHCLESVAAGGGGTHILARCNLHFL